MAANRILSMVLTAFFAGALLPAAAAQELRFGAGWHDITNTEDGADLSVQWVFGPPDLINPDFVSKYVALRPYLVASTNTSGHITFGGIGVQADRNPWRGLLLEFQLGLVTHDGRIDLPPPWMPEERLRVLDTQKTYGCEVLFHLNPSIGWQVTERVSTAIYLEHLSHGKILCDNGKNEGNDTLGLRVGYGF